MSRIVIFTVGTEGDARPYVALGKGLVARGHAVTIATSREFEPLVHANGLEFAPLTADFRALMQRNKTVLDRRSQWAMVRTLMAETSRMATHWAAEGLAAARDAALVIGSGNVSLLAASIAEKLGLPFVRSQLQPFDPSRSLPPPLFRPPPFPLPGAANMALYRVLRILAWRMMGPMIDGVRRELGLTRYPRLGPWNLPNGAGGHILYGISPHVVPRPAEWPSRIAMTGYLILEEAQHYTPSESLKRFLEAGDPPIYIGFGSMISERATLLAQAACDAVRQLGRRAILSSGWAGLGDALDTGDDIIVIDHAPHDWLFPRVSAAVHHCGAGTAAASTRAGIPVVPVPFVGDQFFWAWQLGRLGVATTRIERGALTAARLAAALRRAERPEMRRRAAEIGALVRAEDGVAGAIAQLENWNLLKPPEPFGGRRDRALAEAEALDMD